MGRCSGSGIYTIKCVDNGKIYVGSAINIERRWDRHITDLNCGRHHSAHLQRAWRKYGEGGFRFDVVEYVLPDRYLLMDAEQRWLNMAKSFEPRWGFNIARCSWSTAGIRQSPAACKALGDRMRGTRHSPEWCKRISASLTGNPLTGKLTAARQSKQTSQYALSVETERAMGAFFGVYTCKEIGAMFGVSRTTVSNIKNGKWRKWRRP